MKKRLAFSATSINFQPATEVSPLDSSKLKREINALRWGIASKFRQGVATSAEDTQLIYNGIRCDSPYLSDPLVDFNGKPEFQKLVQRMVAEFWDKIGEPFELACVGYRYNLSAGTAPGNPMKWHQDLHMAKSGGMSSWTGIHYSVDPTIQGGRLFVRHTRAENKENIIEIRPEDGMLFLFDNVVHEHSVEPVWGSGNRTTIIFTAKRL